MCIHIQSVTYMHPDKDVLFSNVSFSMGKGEKVALIGNNGSGKSTLMQLITKELSPSEGEVICLEPPYYIPQHFGQFNHLTIALGLCELKERYKHFMPFCKEMFLWSILRYWMMIGI